MSEDPVSTKPPTPRESFEQNRKVITILAVYSVAAIVLHLLSHWYSMRHPIVDDLLAPSIFFLGMGAFLVNIAWPLILHPDSMLDKKGVQETMPFKSVTSEKFVYCYVFTHLVLVGLSLALVMPQNPPEWVIMLLDRNRGGRAWIPIPVPRTQRDRRRFRRRSSGRV